MTGERSASDVLSLTLPRAGAKRRFRRPHRPSGWQVFWALYCVWCAFWVLHGLADGELATAAINAMWLGAGWICLTRRYRAMPWHIWCPLAVVNLVGIGFILLGAAR